MLNEDSRKRISAELIEAGLHLYRSGLVVAASGNLSARLDEKRILITASGSRLGRLKEEDLVAVELDSAKAEGSRAPSSELPMHSLIYKDFPAVEVVLHCHPPYSNGYFAVRDSLEPLTFEAALYLGKIPVIVQTTPTVTDPRPVAAALAQNKLLVLKNHGIIAVASDFLHALDLAQALEEAVKTALVASIFRK